jgi:hypothetical protein
MLPTIDMMNGKCMPLAVVLVQPYLVKGTALKLLIFPTPRRCVFLYVKEITI